jgi:glutamine synthetase
VLNISCDVYEPMDGKPYDRDPRSIAKRAEAYLKSTGLGDVCYFGPEPEFFIFDGVTWSVDMSGSFVKIKSEEAPWSTGIDYESGNMGHRAPVKGGYFPVPPVDTLVDIRNAMVLALEQQGVECEVHHHEVAAAGQCEIGTRFAPLVQRADWMQILKYTVWNVAHSYGKTATFMPKPVVGDNGSGMHCHQSVWKGGKNLFAGNGYAGLSDFALHYIGGAPTPTSAWCRDSRRRSTSPTRRATARRRAASRTWRAPTAGASRCASPTRPPTRTSRSRRC